MIHTSYTVGITTGEYKALQTVMVDQQEWITNAMQNRASVAVNEITTETKLPRRVVYNEAIKIRKDIFT